MSLVKRAAALANQGEVKLNYDYSQIPDLDRDAVMAAALEIKPRLKRAAADVYAVGEQLNAARKRIPHGQWGDWLSQEFDLTDRTARNFMAVADRFAGKSEIISDLPPTALYLLAAPSTPDAVVEDVIERKQAGQKVGVAEVKKAVQAAKPTEESAIQWLRIYADVKDGRTWRNMEDNQIYHANSTCFAEFAKAFSIVDQPNLCKSLLKSALDHLRKSEQAPPPTEVRPLNLLETKALIARYLERHYASTSDNRKIELVLGFAVYSFAGVIQAGRSLDPGTLQAAKMAIAEGLRGRIEAVAGPPTTAAKEGQPADTSIGPSAAADMIRSIIASGDPHPEVDNYAAAAWARAIEDNYGRRPMIAIAREALEIVARERSAAALSQIRIANPGDVRVAPVPSPQSPNRTKSPPSPTATPAPPPQQRRNVREAVQDALLALYSVKADAQALGYDGSLGTAITILDNLFRLVQED